MTVIEHYENIPMQYTEIFKFLKNENFQQTIFDIFSYFSIKHRLLIQIRTASHLGEVVLTSTHYPQSVFWSKNKKNRYTPVNPIFFYIKVGYEEVYISQTCFPDEFFAAA